MEHKACEGQPCAKGLPTFREQQCQSHDRHNNKRKSSMWTAVINDGEALRPVTPPNTLTQMAYFKDLMSAIRSRSVK